MQRYNTLFPYHKTILILCEESGAFANLYKEAGYNVIVRDLKLDESHDVVTLEYIDKPIDGILAFPPCTHLAGSGARWWKSKGVEKLKEGLSIVDACLRAVAIYKPEFWVIENPVGRLTTYLGKPRLIFNPCEYGGWLDPIGDQYTKKTCLWGDFNIPEKRPVEAIEGSKMHLLPPSVDRAELRSKTPKGFAKAFFTFNQ